MAIYLDSRLRAEPRRLDVANLLTPLPHFADEIGAKSVIAFRGDLLPTGSLKYISVEGMVGKLEDDGGFDSGCTAIGASSSGNTAEAASRAASERGLPFYAVLDKRTAPAKLRRLSASAHVVMVHEPDPFEGWLGARLKKMRELKASIPGLVDLDQYNNLGAGVAHYSFTGGYILNRLRGQIDIAAVAISTGGTAAGIFHRLRDDSTSIATLAVDCAGSILLGRPAGSYKLTGIGAGKISANMRVAYPAMVHLAPSVVRDADAFSECHRLRTNDGLWMGGSSGAVLAAVRQLGELARGKRIVVIFPDGGEDSSETIYSRQWLDENHIAFNEQRDTQPSQQEAA